MLILKELPSLNIFIASASGKNVVSYLKILRGKNKKTLKSKNPDSLT